MPDGQAATPASFRYEDVQARIAAVLGKELFFVGAYPKSGTTWLQRALNGHPEISCNGEGHFFNHFGRQLEAALKNHNKYLDNKNRNIFHEFPPFPAFDSEQFRYLLVSAVALVLSRCPGFESARVIGEKTPDNLGYFPLLSLLFPEAKFVHVVRDARDCAVSAWFHNMRLNPAKLAERYPTLESFLEYVAADWKTRVEVGLRFAAARPDRCMIVHYENMFLQPDTTFRAVLQFLGVDTAPGVVERCIDEASFEKMSGGRPPGAEDRASFMRQGKPGNWRQHFTPESNRKFLSVAGELMGRLGYRA